MASIHLLNDGLLPVDDTTCFHASQMELIRNTSLPSVVDGIVWDEFDSFALAMHRKEPSAELMLDLSYVRKELPVSVTS